MSIGPMRTAYTVDAPPANRSCAARVSVSAEACAPAVSGQRSGGPKVASASDGLPRMTAAFSGPRLAVPTMPTFPVAMPPTPMSPSARTSM
jgi:hypothetical protein